MATYCALDDVRGWLPNGQALDDKTKDSPSAATVTSWITDFSNLIDVAFARAETTLPITDASVLSLLKVRLAHELVYQVMALRSGVEDPDKRALWLVWHAEFEALLAQIAAGELGDTADVSQTVKPFGYPDSSVDPVFTRDQAREW